MPPPKGQVPGLCLCWCRHSDWCSVAETEEQLYLPAGRSFLFCTAGCPSRSLGASLKRRHLCDVLADEDALLI